MGVTLRPEQVDEWLSQPRFHSFLDACDEDHEQAVALYEWNVTVSAAFWEVLHHVEVLLRNATDRQFPATPGDATAPDVPSDVFWITDEAVLTPESLEKVVEVTVRLAHAGHPLTRGRFVAGLPFGFWRALYDRHYDRLWGSILKGAFPNGSGKRKQVSDMLARIHPFRNRIAHHEAIFSAGLQGQHDRLLHLAGLIDRDARRYIAAHSRVPDLLASNPLVG